MIILDVEMSGVNPEKNSIVSIGAVDFSNPERRFYGECKVWDGAIITDEALAVNGYTKDELLDVNKKSAGQLLQEFLDWSVQCDEKTLVGQNPGTDLWFLENTAHKFNLVWPFAHRSFDIHTICAMYLLKQGIKLPVVNNKSAINSDFIMKYVGIPTEPKPHIAINGAIYEAEAFSRLMYGKNLLPEFKDFPLPPYI